MRTFMVILLAAVLTAPAVSMTPAASDDSMQPILQQDARLQRPVTLRLRRRPLSTVISEIGDQAGVTMTAAADVADEPAILYVTSQPAKDVMHHLAMLFRFRWTRQGASGAYSYELYQDLKSKQEEDGLREADRVRAVRALQVAVRERLELAQRSPERLLKEAAALETAPDAAAQSLLPGPSGQFPPLFATTSYREMVRREAPVPHLREMAGPLPRLLVRVLATLSPQQWDLLMSGEVLRFSTRPHPGAMSLPSSLATDLRAAHVSTGPHGMSPSVLSPSDAALIREGAGRLQQDWARAEAFQISVWLDIKNRSFGPADIVLREGARQATQATLSVVPTAVMPSDFQGPTPAPFGLEISGAEILPGEDRPPSDSPPTNGDSVLTRKRPFKIPLRVSGPLPFPVAPSLNDLLPAIAETYGVDLVADAYRQQQMVLPPPPATGDLLLRDVLDQYVLPQARWSRDGTFFHIRRHTWYRDRLGEIPDRLVNYWSGRLAQRQVLSLEIAAEVALSLRDEQLQSFEETMRDVGIKIINNSFSTAQFRQEVIANKDLLRAYGALSPPQRQSLQAGGAVTYAAMSPLSRVRLRDALRQRQRLPVDPHDRWGYPLPLTLAEAAITALSLSRALIRESGGGGRDGYERVEFHLRNGAGHPDISLTIALPRIERKPQREAPLPSLPRT